MNIMMDEYFLFTIVLIRILRIIMISFGESLDESYHFSIHNLVEVGIPYGLPTSSWLRFMPFVKHVNLPKKFNNANRVLCFLTFDMLCLQGME